MHTCNVMIDEASGDVLSLIDWQVKFRVIEENI